MATLAEIERLALDLSEEDRERLAARLLQSLPPGPHDDDEGIAEALRRSADFESDPNIGISLEEFDRLIRARRKG
jgi:putative addiction module component (TIGR02574 family)